jgi:hypothetical protein
MRRFARSTSTILFIRARPMITAPSTGSEPPESPVPAPRGTIGRSASRASRTHAATSSVVAGSTTTRGRVRYASSPSHSYVRKPVGVAIVLRAPTIAAKRAAIGSAAGEVLTLAY